MQNIRLTNLKSEKKSSWFSGRKFLKKKQLKYNGLQTIVIEEKNISGEEVKIIKFRHMLVKILFHHKYKYFTNLVKLW